MGKLNQVVAVIKHRKNDALKEITDVHRSTQKVDSFLGLTRTYSPLKDGVAEQLPPENKNVQLKVNDCIKRVANIMANLFDVVATQDYGNCYAKSNLVIDGKTLINDVPATYFLFLEKQLQDLYTFVEKLPVLDPGEVWNYDAATGLYRSTPVQTHRTKKEPRVIVKAVATEQHPAQTEVIYEDIVVGQWTNTKHSGCISFDEKKKYLEKIKNLQDAVRIARENANSLEVENKKVGDAIMNYIFN